MCQTATTKQHNVANYLLLQFPLITTSYSHGSPSYVDIYNSLKLFGCEICGLNVGLVYEVISTWVIMEATLADLCFCRVLAESSENISQLVGCYPSISFVVKQLESLLEFCKTNSDLRLSHPPRYLLVDRNAIYVFSNTPSTSETRIEYKSIPWYMDLFFIIGSP